MLRINPFFAIVLLLLAGCARQFNSPPEVIDAIPESELVQNNNRLALELYAKLGQQNGNVFFSPSSISTALAMPYAGARGDTAAEMAKTLHFPGDQQRLHPAVSDLMKKLQGKKGEGYELAIANALWVQQGFGLEPAFVNIMKQHYEAGTREVDFVNDAERARAAVNGWVEERTQAKIKDMLQPSDIDRLTRLILANAIYFKGEWATRFPKDGTGDLFFFRGKRDDVRVPFMSQCADLPYTAKVDAEVLQLPYAGKHLSMVIFLPREIDGLPAFEKTLTLENVNQLIKSLEKTKLNLYLPRFKITSRFELGGTLQAMGMPLAFDKNRADFTGITGTDPAKMLHIDKVIHQSFVEVNEEGTEAAGATAVIMTKKGDGPRVVEPPTIYVNRPFVFVIHDNRSGSILFMGRVNDPSK